jgi:hypothetical protein
MPGETGRIYSGVYYTAYIFMDLRSVAQGGIDNFDVCVRFIVGGASLEIGA